MKKILICLCVSSLFFSCNAFSEPNYFSDRLSDVKSAYKKNSADINTTNEAGYTPLIVAAGHGNLDIVKYLVEHGADINYVVPTGLSVFQITALYNSILARKLDVAEYLVAQGASTKGLVPAANLSFSLETMRYVSNICTDKEVKQLKQTVQICDNYIKDVSIAMGTISSLEGFTDKESEKLMTTNLFALTKLYVYFIMIPKDKRNVQEYGQHHTDEDFTIAYKYTLDELKYRNLLLADATDESIQDIIEYFSEKTQPQKNDFYKIIMDVQAPTVFVCTLLQEKINK